MDSLKTHVFYIRLPGHKSILKASEILESSARNGATRCNDTSFSCESGYASLAHVVGLHQCQGSSAKIAPVLSALESCSKLRSESFSSGKTLCFDTRQ